MIRNSAFAAIIASTTIAMCGIAYAQTPAPSPKTSQAPAGSTATSTNPGMEAQVENWTKKQWEAAKKEWAKDKAKWADCRKQSSQQKLNGKKSWSFLYKCMTN